MPQDDSPKEENVKGMDVFFAVMMRLIDSGLGPWIAVCIFILGVIYLGTRNLDSKDTLTLLIAMKFKGFSWLGWLLSFIEIPICRWIVLRERRRLREKMERLETEHDQAIELLKTYRRTEQGNLNL